MKSLKKNLSFLGIFVFCLLSAGAAFADETYQFEKMWPTLPQPWYFFKPFGIAVDNTGNVYVSDTFNYRIQKFGQNGEFIKKWGVDSAPYGITVDQNGDLYVIKGDISEIEKFTADGDSLFKWGINGYHNGEFKELGLKSMGITTHGNLVYVADSGNNRVQIFDSKGKFVKSFGNTDILKTPLSVVVDNNGDIYVSDNGKRIQKFNSDGGFIRDWNLDFIAGGITLDKDGNIYATNGESCILQKIKPDGTISSLCGGCGSKNGNLYSGFGFSISSDGKIYVADKNNDRVQKFEPDGTFISAWQSYGNGNGEFYFPGDWKSNGIATDSKGNVYVSDTDNHRIQKFDMEGNYIKKTGRYGTGDGEFKSPSGIAMDSHNNIYVVDFENNRIQKFDSELNFLKKWGSKGTSERYFDWISGIASDKSDNIYVADTGNKRIQKFTSDGIFITKWDVNMTGSLGSIAVNKITNEIYAVEKVSGYTIQRYDLAGTFLGSWFFEAWAGVGIATDDAGNVYMNQAYNSGDIRKFTSGGTLITSFSGFGSDPGQIHVPRSLCVGNNGKVYVADSGNNRIQIFRRNSPTTPTVPAELKLNSVYPVVGELGKELKVTLTGAGFDYNTRVTMSPNNGIVKKIGYYYKDGEALDIAVSDGIAYIANNFFGLTLIDVRNPSSPYFIGFVDTTGYASGIAVSGNYVYVADGGGFRVIDVSIPSRPIIVGSLEIPGAVSVKVIGDKAYVTYDALSQQVSPSLKIIDVSDPKVPKIIGAANFGDVGGRAYGVTVVGNKAYVTDGINLQIIDVTNPSALTFLGSANTSGFATGIVVVGNTAYVANGKSGDGKSGLRIIDVSNPVRPAYLGFIETPANARNVTVNGNIAYVSVVSDAGSSGSLQIIDVSIPSSPIRVGSADTGDQCWNAAVVGNNVYLATGRSGLSVYDLSQLLPVEVIPDTVISTSISVTFPSPKTAGNYTVRVFNQTESVQMVGAVTFLEQGGYQEQQKRKAIIVAGGGNYSMNSLWNATKKNTDYAYNALIFQGYSRENIYYLSADSIFLSTDRFASKKNMEYTIRTWAQDASDLLIYIVDHGGDGTFRINENEKLYASELAGWLDSVQQIIPGNIILVYDACQSGSFINSLKGKRRIIVTSASAGEPAVFASDGTLSFSWLFWSQIYSGSKFYNAFANSQNSMNLINSQHSLIDADPAIPLPIKLGQERAFAADYPTIGSVSPPQTLTDQTSALIYAENVIDADGISRVWAAITPPDISYSPDIPIIYLPIAELKPVGNNRYETTYAGFTAKGTYKIAIFATDIANFTSIPEQKCITYVQTQDIQVVVKKGDITGDNQVNLTDVISALQVLAGLNPSGVRSDYSSSGADVNGDNSVGMEEVIYILQVVSGLR